MKTLIVIILLAATFLGGYQIGRQEGSPDIMAEARWAWDQMVELKDSLASLAGTIRGIGDKQDEAVCWNSDDSAGG